MRQKHTDRRYEQQLGELRERILGMAGRVEQAIEQTIRAIEAGDEELARGVVAGDADIDRDEMEIDEFAIRILALRQPFGSDLRLLVRAMKMVTDLERVGDHAVSICERVTRQPDGREMLFRDELVRLGRKVQKQLKRVMDAFVHRDPALADKVLQKDDAIDELYYKTFRDVVVRLREHPELLEAGLPVLRILKSWERMGDHATNLAEQVVFMVKGADVRHRRGLGADEE